MALYSTLLLLPIGVAILWIQSYLARRPPKGLNAVPGPPGIPILGHITKLSAQPQREWQKWAREYGEIFQVKLGWENWVMVNSPEAVKEILDKQSAITSSRPPMPGLSDVISGGKRFLLMGYTQEWRKLRAIVHKLLTPKMSETFKPSQEFEAKQLIYDILTDNADQTKAYVHVRRYTTSVVMTSTYGRRVPKWECEEVREVYGLMEEFSESGTPGAMLVDLLPPLARLPRFMQSWRPKAEKFYRRQEAIWMKFWNDLNVKIQTGKAPDCFVRQFVEVEQKKANIDEVQAAFLAGTMIEAGSETTSSALNSCIKYLAANPHIQDIANEEISRVVGDSRSPQYSDEEQLPYIRATVKETLRIRPVTNIGSPHYTTAPVTYKGYYIPANTVVSLSQYAIHFDPAKWSNPQAFDPARYLAYPHKSGVYTAAADANTRDHFDFGAGRRICPGMHLAENSLFITIAKLIWAFEILPPLGANGKAEVVDVSDDAYEPGANTLPKPYKMRFVPRSREREAVLRQEWSTAQKEGFWLGDRKVEVQGMVVD
ncbi:putative O-methylsterigmatocystin oxidoreductase [Elsinoe ampelina]|uniref:Putative O-methylsterigmatocystin oxidoreductase n=1 Tax=Elsinoe ampelina TaxID=302913 RepID=A0A6A6GIM4_9PEZI|nr:putative O-methylsterigmatocystin oxidoreductase [Elsinoe ampelina]